MGTGDGERRYCIIGAGYGGLGIAKAFRDAGIAYDQFEKNEDVGGNWLNGVYRSTHIISSRDTTEYSEFPMPADYPDFPSREQILAYLRAYADAYDLRDDIQFSTEVTSIKPLDQWGLTGWRVELSTGEIRHYAGAVVVNGHHWDKRIPEYPGEFSGKTLHSKDYMDRNDIDGERVLVVGAGNSGCDIAVESSKEFGQAHISMRRGYYFLPKTLFGRPVAELERRWVPYAIQKRMTKLWLRLVVGPNERYGIPKPDHDLWEKHPIVNSQLLYQIRHGLVTVKPDIDRFEGNTVHFVDGSSIEVDTIVYATGFNISFPFLDHDLFEWENGVPKRIAGWLAPDVANLYIFGLLQPRGGAGPLISAGAKLLAEAVKLQEKIPHPVADAMGKKVEPSAELLVGVGETMRNIKKGHLGLKLIERYYRKKGLLLKTPYPIPPAPAPDAEARSAGVPVTRRTVDLDGPVTYTDFGGDGPPVVLVHGLGGSVEDWLSVGPVLAKTARVVALDLRGFGHTPMGEGGSASVPANQALLGSFIRSMFDEPVTLVGNSMGGMISILQASREPNSVSRLILVDPSVPTPEGVDGDPTVVAIFTAYATPGVGEEMMRSTAANMSPEDLVRRTLELCCVDMGRIDPGVVGAHFDLADERAEMTWAHAAHLEAARSLLDLKFRHDDYYELIRAVRAPTLVIQGVKDRLVPVGSIDALREVRPDWEYEYLDDIGHVPMLECPEFVIRSVRRLLEDRNVDIGERVSEATS